MAMKFEEVLIDRIRANGDNIREDMGDMDQLAADVKAMGVQTPIIVYPHPGIEGDYLVQEGHRRRLAAITAGLSMIPCNIKDAPKRGKREDLEVMLTTGRNHKTLTEAEVNHGIQGLLDLDMDVTTIGKKFKMSRSEITARAKLSKGPVELQKRFESGSLDLLAVQKIQDLEESGAEGLLETVVAELESTWNATSSNPHALNRTLERAKTINTSNVEVARLRGLGAEEAPSDASHSGGFRRNAAEMTDEEHIAEGHRFERGKYDDETTWYMPQEVPKPIKTTDAQKAYRQLSSRLNGLLGIAFRARQAFLVEQVRVSAAVSLEADFEMLYAYARHDILRLSPEFLAALTGIDYPEGAEEYGSGYKIREAWLEKVEKRLKTFSWRQIARMVTLYQHKDTDKQLRFLKSFDRTGTDNAFAWRSRASWLEKVQHVFGYVLDSSEVEAIESAKDKAGPDRDKDYDVDTVTEACSNCKQSVVGGEGWDGLCGDCADRAEAAADGSED